jgi:hypothetical protein
VSDAIGGLIDEPKDLNDAYHGRRIEQRSQTLITRWNALGAERFDDVVRDAVRTNKDPNRAFRMRAMQRRRDLRRALRRGDRG